MKRRNTLLQIGALVFAFFRGLMRVVLQYIASWFVDLFVPRRRLSA